MILIKHPSKITARYWTAIMIASMCGTNLGDVFSNVLKLSTGVGLIIQAGLFATILLADSRTRRGNEAFYWLSILLVRAAATNIADFSIEQKHWSYVAVSLALVLLLGGILIVQHRRAPNRTRGDLPPADGFYWFTMLTVGTLGTVMGDGFAHAFFPIQVAAPVSGVVASLALASMLRVRIRFPAITAVTYWLTVVAVRWWGTNMGDILAFLIIGLLPSLAATGAALAATLMLWREPTSPQSVGGAGRGDERDGKGDDSI